MPAIGASMLGISWIKWLFWDELLGFIYLETFRRLPATNRMRPLELTEYFTSAPAGTEPNETPLTKTVFRLISILSPATSARPFVPDKVTSILLVELEAEPVS